MKNHLDQVKPYLKDMINKFRKSDAQKIQLIVAINFFYFKDIDEEHALHTKNNNIEFMIYDKADELIK